MSFQLEDIIPASAIKVEVPGYTGTYFIDPKPETPTLVWVQNPGDCYKQGSRTDLGPDVVVSTFFSPDPRLNGKREILSVMDERFWQHQAFFQIVLDLLPAT